jgi:hypothetical protein
MGRDIVRKLSRLLFAVVLGSCLAGGASAELLRWEGTLTLEFVNPGFPSVPFTGGGMATVNGTGGLGQLTALRLAGGITGSVTVSVTDPNAAPFNGLRPSVALGTGVLGPISGGAGAPPLTQDALPLGGIVRLCMLFECDSYLPIPLTVGGTRGAGIGGLITLNGYGPGIHISVTGAPWTIGTAVASTGMTANGAPTATAVRSGFAHGPASGTTSTANLGGVVQLVTPIEARTTLATAAPWGFFGVLTVTLVPEPSAALLLGAGFAGLALVGRGAKRRRRS